MEINRSELLAVIAKVKPGLASKDIVEEMTHFIFNGSDIITYNDKVCVHHPFKTDFICSLSSKKFEAAISKVKSKEITITNDKKELTIKSASGKTKSTIHIELSMENEIMKKAKTITDEITQEGWPDLPEEFIDSAYKCSLAASTDETSGTRTCIKVEGNIIQCGDGSRFSVYTLEDEMQSFMIKAAALPQLKGYKFDKYLITKSWVHFLSADDVVFSTRLIEGNYLDFIRILDSIEGNEIELPADLKDLIDLSMIMAEGEEIGDKKVTLTLEKNKLTCTSRREEGRSTSETAIDYSGEPLTFKVNPIYLHEILNKVKTIVISEKKALFTSDSFKHVMVLM